MYGQQRLFCDDFQDLTDMNWLGRYRLNHHCGVCPTLPRRRLSSGHPDAAA
jgi:hypothetical protein